MLGLSDEWQNMSAKLYYSGYTSKMEYQLKEKKLRILYFANKEISVILQVKNFSTFA